MVRKTNDEEYEIISGHRRTHAARLAGIEKVPVIIRELSDDDATIVMVDSNIQREEILPSEKAYAFQMKLEAIQHKRNKRRRKQGSCRERQMACQETGITIHKAY